MDRNLRWLSFGGGIRAAGLSLVLPYVALYLRNVLGLGYLEIGLLVATLGVLPLAISPFGGAIADRLGRRGLFLASLVLEASAVVATGAAMRAHSLPGVLGAAGTVSFAGALGGPAWSAYIADLATGSERTIGFTWARIGWNVGFTLGVFSGGALIGVIGFASVGFLAGGILVGSTGVLALRLEPTPYDRDRALGRPRPGDAGSGGRTWRRLAQDRTFLALCATFGIGYLAVNQWSTTFPLYANTVLHLPYADVGVGLALNGLLVARLQAPTTRAALGHRHTGLIGLGVLLYVAGFLFFGAIALVPGLVLAGFLVSVVILTMGENVLSIPYSTLPSNLAPAGELGAYNGAFLSVAGGGMLLASTVGGVVLSFGLNPLATWALLMIPAVPALALLRGWVRPRVPAGPDRA